MKAAASSPAPGAAAELVQDALARLGLEQQCPRCAVAGTLFVSFDPPAVSCTRGCAAVAGAIYEAAARLTGSGLQQRREALFAWLVDVDAAAQASSAITLVRMSEVAPLPVHWLWPGRLPAGMLAVLDGAPGAGKSSVLIDLAARVTTGAPWPAGAERREPRDVILLGHEDSAAHTLRPRLDAAGADSSRVHLVDEVSGRLPRFPDDAAEIEKAIVRTRAVLMAIDPVSAYVGAADMHRDSEVRGALAPLVRVADRTGCAIVMVRHLRKSGGVDAVSRGLGSIAISALARANLMLLRDPDDEEARILTWPLLRVGPSPASLRWRFGDAPPAGGPPRIAWDEAACDLSADEILQRADAAGREPSAVDRAVQWLREELVGGPMPTEELEARAATQGISKRTLERARKKAQTHGFRPSGETRWYTQLRSTPPTSRADGHGGVGGHGGDEPGQVRQLRQDRQDPCSGEDGGDAARGGRF